MKRPNVKAVALFVVALSILLMPSLHAERLDELMKLERGFTKTEIASVSGTIDLSALPLAAGDVSPGRDQIAKSEINSVPFSDTYSEVLNELLQNKKDEISPPLASKALLQKSPAPLLKFDAFTYPGSAVVFDLDTDGAVGKTAVVTVRNSGIRVTNRSGVLLSSVSLNTFWSSVLPVGPGIGAFDPQVTYDGSTGHYFVIAAHSHNGDYSIGGGLLFGRTITPEDPNSQWMLFRIDVSPGNKLAVDRPSLAVSTGLATISLLTYKTPGSNPSAAFGATLVTIYKAQLPSLWVNTMIVPTGVIPQPARLSYSSTAQTQFDSRTYFVHAIGATTLQVSEIGFIPPSSHFHNPNFAQIPTTINLSTPTTPSNEQMASSNLISSVIVYGASQFGDQLLVAYPGFVQTPTSEWIGAIGWTQLNLSTKVVVGSGALRGDAERRAYLSPSVSATSSGAAIGFSTVSPMSYLSAGYAVRSSTPSAAFLVPHLYGVGLAPKTQLPAGSSIRIGDYTVTAPDPLDTCVFWTAQEYQSKLGEESVAWAKFSACP